MPRPANSRRDSDARRRCWFWTMSSKSSCSHMLILLNTAFTGAESLALHRQRRKSRLPAIGQLAYSAAQQGGFMILQTRAAKAGGRCLGAVLLGVLLHCAAARADGMAAVDVARLGKAA